MTRGNRIFAVSIKSRRSSGRADRASGQENKTHDYIISSSLLWIDAINLNPWTHALSILSDRADRVIAN